MNQLSWLLLIYGIISFIIDIMIFINIVKRESKSCNFSILEEIGILFIVIYLFIFAIILATPHLIDIFSFELIIWIHIIFTMVLRLLLVLVGIVRFIKKNHHNKILSEEGIIK